MTLSMTRSKIGFHVAPIGILDGLGIFMQTLDAAGIPLCLKSADAAGPIYEGQELARASGVPHILIYRKSGDGYDVPDYNLTPEQAAIAHWNKHVGVFPPELDKSLVWLETVNELDKERAQWISEFCFHTAGLALRDGYKWAAPGWSAGEPEQYQWETPGSLAFLSLAASHPSQLAIALHEYSYRADILMNDDTYPWLIGRFQELLATCESYGIPRPTILITEFGWTYNDCPDTDLAMNQLEEAAALYAAYDIPVAIWALGPGDKTLNRKVNNIMFPLMDYILVAEFGSVPTPTPVPVPVQDTIDLAQFVVGKPGIQHVLQCRFGDYFQGTQTLCTIDLGDRIYAQQKDRDQEIIYHDDAYIYRETDTSPGDHDGRPAYYVQKEDGKRGAYWCDRYARLSQLFDRLPLVEHCYFDSCLVYASSYVGSQLRLAAYYDQYIFEDGYVFPHPVIELTWEIDGRIIERYFYGHQRGLVGWRQEEFGWRSYLVEEHLDRPPMDQPTWPVCHPRPGADIMYYRGVVPPPPPPPVPPVEPSVYPLLTLARGTYLNVRSGPGIEYRIVGRIGWDTRLHPTDRVYHNSGNVWVQWGSLGWSAQLHRGVTYLVEFGEADLSGDE